LINDACRKEGIDEKENQVPFGGEVFFFQSRMRNKNKKKKRKEKEKDSPQKRVDRKVKNERCPQGKAH
jgi:hypothetical protein